jgi:hypothetical protein
MVLSLAHPARCSGVRTTAGRASGRLGYFGGSRATTGVFSSVRLHTTGEEFFSGVRLHTTGEEFFSGRETTGRKEQLIVAGGDGRRIPI